MERRMHQWANNNHLNLKKEYKSQEKNLRSLNPMNTQVREMKNGVKLKRMITFC
jgi:Tfp pilus assembly protein PilO